MILKDRLSRSERAAWFAEHPTTPEFPPASDREAWKGIASGDVQRHWCAEILQFANAFRSETPLYPGLSAADAFAFIQDGNRSRYETTYFERRNRLTAFVLAECIEYNGEWLPLACEGLWQLVNEAFWYLPAHGEYTPPDPMPNYDRPKPDLFADETAAILALSVDLLADELKAFSPNLLRWISARVEERVLEPVRAAGKTGNVVWWLNGCNNWTPWCGSNTLCAARVFWRHEPEKLAELLEILTEAQQRFYDRYAPDGACDEGPGYFEVAGLEFLTYLERANGCTEDAFSAIYQEEKFRNIGEYAYKSRFCGPWVTAYADNRARMEFGLNPGRLYRYGERTGSAILRRFAVHQMYECGRDESHFLRLHVARLNPMVVLERLFWTPLSPRHEPVGYPAFMALPDLQFYLYREHPENEYAGFIASLKGGHNGEGHNHNDVGQFEVFFDGEPAVVDLGNSTYTRFTFSPRRYEDWVRNSKGHNVPEFNGVLQGAGGEFRARVVTAGPEGVTLDLTNAYPPEAGVKYYERKLIFGHGECVIEECCDFTRPENRIRFDLYGPASGVKLECEGIDATPPKPFPLEDELLRLCWGDTLQRTTLSTVCGTSHCWRLRFKQV